MATSNFHNVNSSKIFAVELEDEWDYDDLLSNIKYSFDNNGKYDISETGEDPYELRSYPSRMLLSVEDSYGDLEEGFLTIKVCVIIRSGYYSGVNLDWVCFFDYDDSYEEFEDLVESMKYNDVYLTEEQKQEILKRREDLIEYVEKQYEKLTIPLNVVARFSNGETIYEKA